MSETFEVLRLMLGIWKELDTRNLLFLLFQISFSISTYIFIIKKIVSESIIAGMLLVKDLAL